MDEGRSKTTGNFRWEVVELTFVGAWQIVFLEVSLVKLEHLAWMSLSLLPMIRSLVDCRCWSMSNCCDGCCRWVKSWRACQSFFRGCLVSVSSSDCDVQPIKRNIRRRNSVRGLIIWSVLCHNPPFASGASISLSSLSSFSSFSSYRFSLEVGKLEWCFLFRSK